MSSAALDAIRNKALELSESERAELAHDLLKSLDGPADNDAQVAWAAEIDRRLKQIDEDSVQPLDRAEFERRIRRHFAPR